LQTEKKLNLTEQKGCEGFLNKAECLKALKDMECNKTPVSDSLPAEFYKVFWNDISDLFLNLINYAYRIGQLSVTQRRGIIKLIPKKIHIILTWIVKVINKVLKKAIKCLGTSIFFL